MNVVKAVLSLEEGAAVIALMTKQAKKLKGVGLGLIGGAGLLIGFAIKNFEKAVIYEQMAENNQRVYDDALSRNNAENETEA